MATLNALPVAAQTEAGSELPQPIEQCIRDNAPAVERAVPSLNEAVDFLVTDVCAKPIADERTRQQAAIQAKYLDAIKKRCATSKPSGKKADDAMSGVCAAADSEETGLNAAGWTIFEASANKPAGAASLAAKTLLDIRIQRMNATSTQGTH